MRVWHLSAKRPSVDRNHDDSSLVINVQVITSGISIIGICRVFSFLKYVKVNTTPKLIEQESYPLTQKSLVGCYW